MTEGGCFPTCDVGLALFHIIMVIPLLPPRTATKASVSRETTGQRSSVPTQPPRNPPHRTGSAPHVLRPTPRGTAVHRQLRAHGWRAARLDEPAHDRFSWHQRGRLPLCFSKHRGSPGEVQHRMLAQVIPCPSSQVQVAACFRRICQAYITSTRSLLQRVIPTSVCSRAPCPPRTTKLRATQ